MTFIGKSIGLKSNFSNPQIYSFYNITLPGLVHMLKAGN